MFCHPIPSSMFLEFIQSIANVQHHSGNKRLWIINEEIYLRCQQSRTELLFEFINECRNYYYECKQFYLLNALSDYAAFLTVMRQICKHDKQVPELYTYQFITLYKQNKPHIQLHIYEL